MSAPASAYERYRPALRRKAERMLRSRAMAEDLVQSLFVDLLAERIATFDFPYLYRAVANRCLNVLRDDRRRHELLMRRAESPTFCSQEAEAVVTLDLLLKWARSLAPEVLEAASYVYLDEMTQDEAGLLMGLSRKTIGKYLSEAEAVLHRLKGGSE